MIRRSKMGRGQQALSGKVDLSSVLQKLYAQALDEAPSSVQYNGEADLDVMWCRVLPSRAVAKRVARENPETRKTIRSVSYRGEKAASLLQTPLYTRA
jgi:hypothetical protein